MPIIPPQFLQWVGIRSLLKYESWQGPYFATGLFIQLWFGVILSTPKKPLSIETLHDFSPIDLNFDFQGHANKIPLPCRSRSFVLWWKENWTGRRHMWGQLQLHQVRPWDIRQVATLCLHFFIYRLSNDARLLSLPKLYSYCENQIK